MHPEIATVPAESPERSLCSNDQKPKQSTWLLKGWKRNRSQPAPSAQPDEPVQIHKSQADN
jgi:hypothetical protein